MKTKDVIEGLTILSKYNDQDGCNMGAEHDQVYVYATDKPVETADLERLVELGWFQPDANYGEDDFAVEHYDSEEGWSCFV